MAPQGPELIPGDGDSTEVADLMSVATGTGSLA